VLIIQYLHFDPNYSYLYLGNRCEREEEYKYLRQLKFPTNSLANTCILMCVGLYKFAGSNMQVFHTLEENANVSLYNYSITGHIALHREPTYLRSLHRMIQFMSRIVCAHESNRGRMHRHASSTANWSTNLYYLFQIPPKLDL
jgi:hypothetical protein